MEEIDFMDTVPDQEMSKFTDPVRVAFGQMGHILPAYIKLWAAFELSNTASSTTITSRPSRYVRASSSAVRPQNAVMLLSLTHHSRSSSRVVRGDDSSASDSDSDPYSSDHFHMFVFKVRRCTRSRSHDWTDCPFVHPGKKARRRYPRKYHYSGTVGSAHRRGSCRRWYNCEFSHGVFECWHHPSRYRTEACKDGKNCKRKV